MAHTKFIDARFVKGDDLRRVALEFQRRMIASVDAADGERAATNRKNAVHQKQFPKVLNTTRGQAIQLVKSGILPPFFRKEMCQGRAVVR